MRRPLATFFLGFASGMLFLAALFFWRMSAPATTRVSAAPPRADGLLIPVEGTTAKDLRDSFEETHNGHRHEAIDILAPRGTPVLAVTAGTVAKLFTSKPGGLTVYQFDDTQTWCYYYAHLDRYAADLSAGKHVGRGDVLGYVGTTGNAPPDTPHLHFAISKLGPEKRWWEGTPVNPFPLLLNK